MHTFSLWFVCLVCSVDFVPIVKFVYMLDVAWNPTQLEMADEETPDFTAADAKALLEFAALPAWPTSGAVTVTDVASLPSYDDKNWLVTARCGDDGPEHRCVVKVSLAMPVPRVQGQAAAMRALSARGVPTAAMVALGRGPRATVSADAKPARLVLPGDTSAAVTPDDFVWGWQHRTDAAKVASICAIAFVADSCDLFDHPARSTPATLLALGDVVGRLTTALNTPGDDGYCCAHDPAALVGLRREAKSAEPGSDVTLCEGWGPWDGRCAHLSYPKSLAHCGPGTVALCAPHRAAYERLVVPQLRALPPVPLDATVGAVPPATVEASRGLRASYLPWALIHSDVNEFNVLVAKPAAAESSSSAAAAPAVATAVIDYGDMCYSHRVFELAHCACYMLQLVVRDAFPASVEAERPGKATAAAAAAGTEEADDGADAAPVTHSDAAMSLLLPGMVALCSGYAKSVQPPLTLEELRATVPCLLARAVMSVATSEAAVAQRGEVDEETRAYLLASSASGRAVLRILFWRDAPPPIKRNKAGGPRVCVEALVDALVAAVPL